MQDNKKLILEKDYIDFMTDMGFSSNLLEGLNLALSKSEYRTMSLETFYGMWMKKNNLSEIICPYNFGVIIGELYCGLVFAKENWIDLLPDVLFSDIDDSWGIKTDKLNYSEKSEPTLRDVVRRIRNSLGHSNFEIELSEIKSYPELFNEAIINFWDSNIKKPEDKFSISLKICQLKIFYAKFRDVAFKSILESDGKEVGVVNVDTM